MFLQRQQCRELNRCRMSSNFCVNVPSGRHGTGLLAPSFIVEKVPSNKLESYNTARSH